MAVAWFTDSSIYNELLNKKNEGVDIKLITTNEASNNYLLEKFDKNFDLKLMDLRGFNKTNRMHDKFCIIDLEFVMHGSYNWSKNAVNNDETLATAIDKDFVLKFADEFIRLKNGG